jgi:hypothetical protein
MFTGHLTVYHNTFKIVSIIDKYVSVRHLGVMDGAVASVPYAFPVQLLYPLFPAAVAFLRHTGGIAWAIKTSYTSMIWCLQRGQSSHIMALGEGVLIEALHSGHIIIYLVMDIAFLL